MSTIRLDFSAEKCVGCRLCELICSASHNKKFNPKKSAILIDALFPEPGAFKAIFCIQCDEHPCVDACPVEAIKKTDLGIYVVDRSVCTGCEACIDVCPYQALWMEPNSLYAIKCNLCDGEPQCIGICPAKALSLAGGR